MEPRPGHIGLGKRLLHQVLRELIVAQDQVRDPEQGSGTRTDELAELLFVPAGVSRHLVASMQSAGRARDHPPVRRIE